MTEPLDVRASNPSALVRGSLAGGIPEPDCYDKVVEMISKWIGHITNRKHRNGNSLNSSTGADSDSADGTIVIPCNMRRMTHNSSNDQHADARRLVLLLAIAAMEASQRIRSNS